MPKYVFAYHGGGMPESEEEQAVVMKAWGDWFETLGEKLVDGGNPTGPDAKTIDSDGLTFERVLGKAVTHELIAKSNEVADTGVAIIQLKFKMTIWKFCTGFVGEPEGGNAQQLYIGTSPRVSGAMGNADSGTSNDNRARDGGSCYPFDLCK